MLTNDGVCVCMQGCWEVTGYSNSNSSNCSQLTYKQSTVVIQAPDKLAATTHRLTSL